MGHLILVRKKGIWITKSRIDLEILNDVWSSIKCIEYNYANRNTVDLFISSRLTSVEYSRGI
jgi:hypothetical protein